MAGQVQLGDYDYDYDYDYQIAITTLIILQ